MGMMFPLFSTFFFLCARECSGVHVEVSFSFYTKRQVVRT